MACVSPPVPLYPHSARQYRRFEMSILTWIVVGSRHPTNSPKGAACQHGAHAVEVWDLGAAGRFGHGWLLIELVGHDDPDCIEKRPNPQRELIRMSAGLVPIGFRHNPCATKPMRRIISHGLSPNCSGSIRKREGALPLVSPGRLRDWGRIPARSNRK